MAYPYLPSDFDERYETGWVTVPNSLWDSNRSRGLYQEYIDQLAYADELGFDGLVLNEHHQNIYGLMPSPNLIVLRDVVTFVALQGSSRSCHHSASRLPRRVARYTDSGLTPNGTASCLVPVPYPG